MAGTLYVYQDANLTRQLKTLLKGGASAAPAARHAQTIIDRFADGMGCDPKLMGRLTRYGDARIKELYQVRSRPGLPSGGHDAGPGDRVPLCGQP